MPSRARLRPREASRVVLDRAHAGWFECTSAAAQSGLFYPVAVAKNLAKRRDRACLVTSHTDLVIDGAPRSANGFATYTFLAAQRHPVRVAHHLHSGEQVVRAARRHIPVLLLIREPAAAALAVVGAWPYIGVGQALRAYVRYYGRAGDVADDCVIGFFDEVTSDFGRVLQRVNDRYRTSFDVVHPTAESARRLYDPDAPDVVARKAWARAAASHLEEPANRALLRSAQRLWEAFQRHR